MQLNTEEKSMKSSRTWDLAPSEYSRVIFGKELMTPAWLVGKLDGIPHCLSQKISLYANLPFFHCFHNKRVEPHRPVWSIIFII